MYINNKVMQAAECDQNGSAAICATQLQFARPKGLTFFQCISSSNCRQSRRNMQVREGMKRSACHRYNPRGWAAMHSIQLMPMALWGCMKQ